MSTPTETSQTTSLEVFLLGEEAGLLPEQALHTLPFHARSVIWITFWDIRRTPEDCWTKAREGLLSALTYDVVCHGSCLLHTATDRRG